MKPQFWRVVGGASHGGIVVRTSRDTTSPQEEERLSTGAIIEELELDSERLQYLKLQGSGPVCGWVSLKFKNANLVERADVNLEPAPRWRVVGGKSHGGIVVRSGKETSSPQETLRLHFGAIVRELELDDGRLHYQLVDGNGPRAGWVSLYLKDTPLLVKSNDAQVSEQSTSLPNSVSRYPLEPGKKMRVLAIHGQAGNSNIMKVQVLPLKRALGKHVEWLFTDAKEVWRHFPEAADPFLREDRSDGEKLISKGKDFYTWWKVDYEVFFRTGVSTYDNVADVCSDVSEFVRENGPIDVAVCWSQGSNMVAILTEVLRREGKGLPWRLSVFFAGGMIDDHRFDFSEPSAHPTIRVTGGKSDVTRHPDGEDDVSFMYSNLLEIEHEDGHALPKTEPRAGEIYEQPSTPSTRCDDRPATCGALQQAR